MRGSKGYFDVHPGDWDGIYSAPRGSIRAVLNRRLRRAVWGRMAIALSECAPLDGRSALDVGCGPGELAIRLAERGASGVVGIDSAVEMVRLATRRAAARGMGGRCRFVHADFPSDELGAQTFDFTIALGVLDYVTDAPHFLQEMWRRTRSRLIVSFPRDVPPRSWLRRLWHGAHGSRLHYYGPPRVLALAAGLQAAVTRLHSIPGTDFTDVLVCDRSGMSGGPGVSSVSVQRWDAGRLGALLESVW